MDMVAHNHTKSLTMNRLLALLFLLLTNAPVSAFLTQRNQQKIPTNSFERTFPVAGPQSTSTIALRPKTESSSSLAFATSPEPIHTLFSVATFGPQPFWLFLILLPKAEITKKLFGGFDILLLFCLVHFAVVVGSIATEGSGATAQLAEFNNVFDPSGDPQNAFMKMVTFPNFVAEEWSHVLSWDLFVGRYIWMDGLKRGIFTSHSVLLSNLIGPPGLLLHWLTCLLVGKEPWEKDEI